MKRIYIYLTMLAAILTMAGCSNEDVVGPDPVPQGEEDIALTIGVGDGMTVVSKAEFDAPEGKPFESEIKKLTAILFKDGNNVASKTVKPESPATTINKIGDIIVPVETYDIFLIANGPEGIENVKTFTALSEMVMSIDSQENGLVMTRYLPGVELQAAKDGDGGLLKRRTYNYLLEGKDAKEINDNIVVIASDATDTDYSYGDTERIILTRLVARVQFESLKVDFEEWGESQFKGATFKLENVYVVNVRPNTLIHPGATGYESDKPDANDFVYYRGAPAEGFKIIDHRIAPEPLSTMVDNTTTWNPLLKSYVSETDGAISIVDGANYDFTAETTRDMFSCYVFENATKRDATEGQTTWDKDLYDARFVIEGQIYFANGNPYPEKSYYHVILAASDTEQLVHNKIYRIQATIKALGSNEPDGPTPTYTTIETTITVNPWKVINQYEED